MLSTIYFWKDKQVHIYEGDNTGEAIRATGFYRCFAVDTSIKSADLRYGVYTKTVWKHVPLDKFPPEFRTALLLLGIT